MTGTQNDGEPVLLEIHDVAHGGAGVGREIDRETDAEGAESAGPVWFVDGALPGEQVLARARKRAKRHVEADLVEVRRPSEARTLPPCPFAAPRADGGLACGGCQWQHVHDAEQAGLKLQIAAGQLRRLPVTVDKVVPSPRSVGYRRRARLHYEVVRDDAGEPSLRLGFFGQRSHDLVDVDRCLVLEPPLDHALQRLRAAAGVLPERGEVHGLTDGERTVLGLPGVRPEAGVHALLESLLDDNLVGITLRGGRQRHTVGVAALAIDAREGTGPGDAVALPAVLSGPFVFSQAQAEQNEALVRHVIKAARPKGHKVLELFAGSGNFTRGLAAEAEGVWASDDDKEAVLRLRDLADGTQLPIRARKDAAATVLSRLARDGRTYDVVVLDPPRTGLGKEGAQALAQVADRVVYVSCDPATLARDLQVLFDDGFEAVDVRVFDLMPMTAEVEVVATLKRVRARNANVPPHRLAERRSSGRGDGGSPRS